MAFITTWSVEDKDQSDGDQTVSVQECHNQGGYAFPVAENWQGHIEVKLTSTGDIHVPNAGTMTIYGVPKGGTAAGKISLGTIDLTGSDLLNEWSGVYDSIILSPSSLDADCSYDFYISAWN